jgi:ATP-dependent protease ClpP protease subunit
MNEEQIIQMIQPQNNVIQTPFHSLHIIENPERYEPVEINVTYVDENGEEIPDPEFPTVYKKVPESKDYILHLGEFMAEGNENQALFTEILKADPNSQISIFIASEGGNFFEIVQFYNLMVPKFDNIITYLHTGYSAGSMAFLLGTTRYVYEHSDMMVHSYTGVNYGKRDDMLNQTHHQDKMITTFFKKIYSPYFTKKEIKRINKGEDFWMDSKEMLKRGIATHIITDSGEVLDYKGYKKR